VVGAARRSHRRLALSPLLGAPAISLAAMIGIAFLLKRLDREQAKNA
jgi:hypothetical protein